MKNHKFLVLISLLLVSTLFAIPATTPSAKAQFTGEVCLAEPGTSGCPASPPVFFASPGSQLMVAVNIAGSNALNGFDIQILVDSPALQAADVDLTGGLLGATPSILAECLDGAAVIGVCAPQDGPGVLHLAASKLGAVVPAPATGLLFTAIYNVPTAVPFVTLSFQTGCSNTSVAPDVCVTISNGTLTPVPIGNVQGATFSNLTDFGMVADPASHTIPPGSTGTSIITLTSFGGLEDFIDLAVFPTGSLMCTLDAGVFLPADGTATATLACSSTVSGSFSALVTGTTATHVPTIMHDLTVPYTVTPADFSVTASPTTLTIPPGGVDTSTITVASISGFTGTVTLTATVTPAGPMAALSPGSVSLTANGIATSILTVTVPAGTASGTYTVDVTGTGSGPHTATVTVIVGAQDFSLVAIPDSLSIPRTSDALTLLPVINHGTSRIDIISLNNFAATIDVSVVIVATLLDTPGDPTLGHTLTSSMIILPAGGKVSVELTAFVSKTTTGTGLYTATLTATGGGKMHTVDVLFYVIDFSMSIADPVITVTQSAAPSTPVMTTATITALGPQSDLVNPGFDGALFRPLPYNYPIGTGRLVPELGIRVCVLETFDSNGNLIPLSTLVNQGPIVYAPGPFFGFLGQNRGCRLDSAWFVSPEFTLFGEVFPTVIVLSTTPAGTYTVRLCELSGSVINCINFQVVVVAAAAPAFHQFLWKDHKLSLSPPENGIQTFVVGITSPAGNIPLSVQVEITAVSADGTMTFVATSDVMTLLPGSSNRINNLAITMDLSSASSGVVFNFSARILYSADGAAFLTSVSTKTLGTSDKPIGAFLIQL